MTDEEIVGHSRRLRQEASELLNKEGLLRMLKTFGTTQVIGSYALDMMTWPDIDISMNLPDEQNVELFFELAKRIATKFEITRMSYSNHFIRNFPGFDHGLYWGIRLHYAEREWKIDLWGYDDTDYQKHIADAEALHRQLQQTDRVAILRIKHVICQHPDHRGNVYNSMAIYRAVLEDKVESVDEFKAWLEKTHTNA
jgi:hypothetical protein